VIVRLLRVWRRWCPIPADISLIEDCAAATGEHVWVERLLGPPDLFLDPDLGRRAASRTGVLAGGAVGCGAGQSKGGGS